jgi:hypothetical protein
MSATAQGRPSPSRANLGLDDPIPLGLKHTVVVVVESIVFYSTENSEEPLFPFYPFYSKPVAKALRKILLVSPRH